MSILLYKELSDRIIGCAFAVHKGLGPGLLESVYETAFCIELSACGIPFERQKTFRVFYKGYCAGEFTADLVVAGKVLLELKSVKELNEVMAAQTVNYLRVSGIEVGYLMNFRNRELSWKRFVCRRE